MRGGPGSPARLVRPEGPLREIYRRLLRAFGPQGWWPKGEVYFTRPDPFEVAVGAILTQNTAWANAARAVAELRRRRRMRPAALAEVPRGRLAGWIRPSGYFNQKAVRLKILARHLVNRYGGRISRMRAVPAGRLRSELLTLPGIGPETADSILLYALNKPVFVVDAYTRRVLARHGLIPPEASYEEIQTLFMKHLPHRSSLYNEYHALLVALGKDYCRKSAPLCRRCPVRGVGKLRLETGAVPAR